MSTKVAFKICHPHFTWKVTAVCLKNEISSIGEPFNTKLKKEFVEIALTW